MDCKSKDVKRPIYVLSTGGRIFLIGIVLLTILLFRGDHHVLVDCGSSPSPTSSEATFNADAADSLNYEKGSTADERKKQIKNQKPRNAATNKYERDEIRFTYENDQGEKANLTYDELVFEALDKTYLSRLTPAYLYNYDNKKDRSRTSDPRLLSRAHCDHELNHLVEQMYEIKRGRLTPSKEGLRLSQKINHELLGFFDAYTNEESGLLEGNYHWTGNSPECSKRLIFYVDKKNLSNSVDTTGRFCLASLRSRAWDSEVAERAQKLKKINFFKYPGQEKDYKRFHRVQVGLCLPQSCDSSIVSSRRYDIQQLATFKLKYPLTTYNLVDLFCLPDEWSEYRQLEPAGKLFVILSIVWLLLIALATYYDCKNPAKAAAAAELIQSPPSTPVDPASQQSRPQLTMSQRFVSTFSLTRNFKRLLETKSCQPSPPISLRFHHSKDTDSGIGDKEGRQISDRSRPKLLPNDLLFLNGIKVLSMLMVVLAHTEMRMKQSNRLVLDIHFRTQYRENFHSTCVFCAYIFFVISSFLTAYITFVTNKVARNTVVDWIYSVVHRYWRLAPIYIILFCFAQSLFMHTGSGPLWDYGSNSMTFRSICRRESYWYPLTLTANLHPIYKECILPAWYASSDMQFFLIVPILLVLLHKSAFLGWLVTSGAIVASIALRTNLHLPSLREPRADVYLRDTWDMHEYYFFPQYHVAAYLIGLLAGHYAYMVLSGKWKSAIFFHPAAWFVGKPDSVRQAQFKMAIKSTATKRLIVTISGMALMYMMSDAEYWVEVLYSTEWKLYSDYFAQLIYGLSQPAASLALAVILTTLMFGQWEPLRQFISHPAWTILSRLNYILLLTQVEVINWALQQNNHLEDFHTHSMYLNYFHIIATLYPLAAILALLVEQPLIQLERHFIAPAFKLWTSPSDESEKKVTSNTGAKQLR